MKISVFVFLFFLMSCNKNDESKFKHDDLSKYQIFLDKPIATAQKNIPEIGSIEWKGNVLAYHPFFHPERVAFEINTYAISEDSLFGESLEIGNIPIEVGKYRFDSIHDYVAAYGIRLADGDVISDVWLINNSYESFVEIECLDTINRTMEASFNIFLENIDAKDNNPNLSDYVNFLNGNFTVNY